MVGSMIFGPEQEAIKATWTGWLAEFGIDCCDEKGLLGLPEVHKNRACPGLRSVGFLELAILHVSFDCFCLRILCCLMPHQTTV
jgi:hypothetical protein